MKNFTLFLSTEEDTLTFAAKMANAIEEGMILFLNGPLGAGKTTFVRGFLRGLGFGGKVKSPTYTLVEPYELNHRFIFHFDLYRLHNANELEQIGIQEYFTPTSICLVEWPEKGFPLLPEPDLTCYINFVGENREIQIKAHSTQGENVLKKVGK